MDEDDRNTYCTISSLESCYCLNLITHTRAPSLAVPVEIAAHFSGCANVALHSYEISRNSNVQFRGACGQKFEVTRSAAVV
jgi:hypothetical protein